MCWKNYEIEQSGIVSNTCKSGRMLNNNFVCFIFLLDRSESIASGTSNYGIYRFGSSNKYPNKCKNLGLSVCAEFYNVFNETNWLVS